MLAAGEGIRLQPLTATRPKHMLSVGGKPILEHVLNVLRAAGVQDILVVTHYREDMIRQYFEKGQNVRLRIEYAHQHEMHGTSDALRTAEPFVKDDFLLVYGDLLFTAEAVKVVIEKHNEKKAAITVSTVPVENTENYGIVELSDDDTVTKIAEKPLRGETTSNLANAGIYAFDKDIFGEVSKTSSSSRGELEIPDLISLYLQQGKTVTAARLTSENWLDIGRPWDLLNANRWILTRMRHRLLGTVEPGATILGSVTVAETARIRSGAYVEGPALIDDGSDVGPNCFIRPFTTLGKHTRVGNACEIKCSLLMDHVHVGHLSYVGDSILGEKCNLGAGTITGNYRFDAGSVKMQVKDKVIDTGLRKLGSVFGDNVKTGINALIMPGVKVGQNSWVGPNVILQRDLPPDTKVVLRQSLETGSLAD